METADFECFPVAQAVEKKPAAVVFQRIGVRQHPFSVRRIGAVPVAGEKVSAYDFRVMRPVRIEIILPAGGVAVGEIDDLIRADPCVVGTHLLQIQREKLRSVEVCREHVRQVPSGGAVFVFEPPAVEECETAAVGADQDMVEPAFRVFHVGTVPGVRDLRHADDQLCRVVFEINQPDAFVAGAFHLFIGVECAGIAVTGTFPVQPREVQAHRPSPVGAQAVDRTAQGLRFARLHIQDAGDEMIPLAVIVNDFCLGIVEPLEHAPLLPAPGVRLGKRHETVVVREFDHSQRRFFSRTRLPGCEINLLREQSAPGFVPRELVEIAEKMVFRPLRHSLNRKRMFLNHSISCH